MPHKDRIVILVDADCFYCQVEEKLDPSLTGKPIAVVQFNAWRDGGIIAVNYAARAKGCTKGMWMNEARQNCPEIKFARVTNVRGRADLTKYRDASKQVADVLLTFTQNIERASIDESYIDVTDLVNKKLENGFQRLTISELPNTHVVGCETSHFLTNLEEYNEFTESNCRLALGGLIAHEMRTAIFQKTGYKCSAGIAHNKILAKLACGFHKPNQQTILPSDAVPELFSKLPLKKIKRLGGKFGESISKELQVTNVGDLLKFGEKELAQKFDAKTGKWLFNIARGIDLEPVTTRVVSKSISCCKRFPFNNVLRVLGSVEHWLNELAIEVTDRLEQELTENNRRARHITVSFAQEIEKKTISGSKSFPIICFKQEKIFRDAFEIVRKNLVIKADGSLMVTSLGLTAGNFQENTKNSIVKLLKNYKTRKTVDNIAEDQTRSIENAQEEAVEKADTSPVKFRTINASTSKCTTIENERDNTELTNNNNINSTEEEIFLPGHNPLFTNVDIKFSYDDCSFSSNKFNLSTNGDKDEEGKDVEEEYQNESVPRQNGSETYEEYAQSYTISQNNEETRLVGGHENVEKDPDLDASTTLKDQYAKSFFLNYFANMEKKNREDRTREMNFQELTESIFRKSALTEDSIGSRSTFPEPEPTQEVDVCLECRKYIPRADKVSHMDYHFARKLANEDRKTANANTPTLYSKRTQNISPSSKKSKRSTVSSSSSSSSSAKNLKVKKGNSSESKPITSFLEKIDGLNDSNSDVCGDCKKRVRFEDLDNHSDYHAAKKLHTELNSDIKLYNNFAVDKSLSKNSVRTSRDISSFFKKA